jgi:hypothetical protein
MRPLHVWFPVVATAVLATSRPAAAADLQPQTIAAFDRYVRAVEAQTSVLDPFLRIDALGTAEKAAALAAMRRGDVFVERLQAREGSRAIDIPDGLVHHWLGAVFVPGVALEQAVALMQDYDRHAEMLRPAVARSRLLSRNGDEFRVYLRFTMKKVVTVVVNTENEARFIRLGPDRAQSRIISTRIAEVENPDTPEEAEKPEGHDGGFLWRFNTYWRFVERDGGTYVQCEALSLTRGIPVLLRWLIGPFLTSIPRESLTFSLERIRRQLIERPPVRP